MADAVLTSPAREPVPTVKAPVKPAAKPAPVPAKPTGDQVLSKQPELPAFLPPKAPEEMEPLGGSSLTIQKPGEEPVTEAMEQKVWDVRRQEYVEPYKKAGMPAKPAEGKQAKGFPTRDEFEQFAFQAIGGNPFKIEPTQEVIDATKDLRPLFNYAFNNKVYWGDRDKLSQEQKTFWDSTVKAYRAQVYNHAAKVRQEKIDVYNHMLSKYSDELNEQKAAEDKIAAQNAAILAAARERRLTEVSEAREERMVAAEERKAEAAQRAEEREARLAEAAAWKKQQDIMKGLKPEEPSRSDIQAIARAESDAFDAVDADDNFIMEKDEELGRNVYTTQLNPKTLKDLNAAREAAGMPELYEIVTTVPDGNRYQYLEAPEAEFDKEVKKQYPNAVKYGDAWWALLPNGQYRKITAGE